MAQPNPRGIQIGAPGPNIPKVRFDTTAGPVAAALAVYEAAHPWIIVDSTTFIDELMNAGVMYEFDTLDDVFLWARIRLVTTELMRVVTAGANSQWRMRYHLLETQRAEFQRVGELNPVAGPQVFTCLGINYTLVKSDTNHYYVDRNGRTVTYNGALTDTKLRSILGLLHKNQPATGADTAHIDEFVCACLAEPTRWPEEQAFTLLAATTHPGFAS